MLVIWVDFDVTVINILEKEKFGHKRIDKIKISDAYYVGHADIGVTLNTYTHVYLEDVQEEMKRVENIG